MQHINKGFNELLMHYNKFGKSSYFVAKCVNILKTGRDMSVVTIND